MKPRHVRITTNRHRRVAGVTWDILACVHFVGHHDSDLGRWARADAATVHGPLIVASGNEDRLSLEPRHMLRLAVLV